MKDSKKYIGLDVSKDFIAVAIANEGRDHPRYLGQISNNQESIRKLFKKLGEGAFVQSTSVNSVVLQVLARLILANRPAL
ncbi:hypothetical protein ACOJUR_10930 [Alicyclobacillus tolerans]|uniref:hypothetical protein n=1 Tax=Alicyclobacillus tolerans TaxID=90970 RepID=UPI003B81D81F